MTHFDKMQRSLGQQAPPPMKLDDEELDFLAIFRIVRRRIGLIVTVGTLVVAFSLPPILSMERSYYGQTRLLMQKPLSRTLTPSAGGPEVLDPETEIQRLLARNVVAGVVRDLGIADRPEFNPALREPSLTDRMIDRLRRLVRGTPASAPSLGDEDPLDLVLPEFYGALGVGQSSPLVIDIGFTSLDPELAGEVPNALVRVYREQREAQMRAEVSDALSWLDARVETERQRLSAALADVQAFRDANGLVSADQRGDLSRTISDLSARKAGLATERAGIETELAAIDRSRRDGTELPPIDTAEMAQLRRDLRERQAGLAKLLETFGENYGVVVDARAAVAETEDAIAGEADRYAQTLRLRYGALDHEEAAIGAALDAARETLGRAGSLAADLAGLQATVDQEQEAVDELEEQRRAVSREGELPATSFEVLTPASVPLGPQGRGKLIYLIFAMIGAGCVAVTVALVREMLDRGLRSGQQLDAVPGANTAGLLPRLSRRAARAPGSVLLTDRGGMFADSLRGIFLSLGQGRAGRMPRSLLVTSTHPGEGKSTIAAALAIELAAEGNRVLLVDADLRHGRVHGLFGQAVAGTGLSDLLAGAAEIADVIRRDEASGVEYITHGSAPRFVPLGTESTIARILEHAQKLDRILIVDGPPTLATTDPALLAGLVEQTLMVVRWSRTQRRALDLAVERLAGASRNELAIVLNAVDPRRHALYGFRDSGLFTGKLKKYYHPGGS